MGAKTVPPTWRLGDLHHLGLTVADIERSIRFYRDTLGMTLVRRRPHVDNDYVAAQTGYPGVVLNVASFKVSPHSPHSLEVVQYMNHAGPPAQTATNRPGNSHLCITVNDLRPLAGGSIFSSAFTTSDDSFGFFGGSIFSTPGFPTVLVARNSSRQRAIVGMEVGLVRSVNVNCFIAFSHNSRYFGSLVFTQSRRRLRAVWELPEG